MADGALWGRRTAVGTVAHTDGAATTVASVTLPTTPDGRYVLMIRASGGTAARSSNFAMRGYGDVIVDAGDAMLGQFTGDEVGGTGFTASLAFPGGGVVQFQIAAANGVRSVAVMELYGVEMAIAAA